jgi:hypothetical protein
VRDVHIKRKHGEYLLGRSSDRSMANSPRLYSNSVHLGYPTVADSIDSTLQLRSQQRHLGTSQYSDSPNYPPVHISPNFANPMYRPMPIAGGQSYGTGLSQHAMHKIQEVKVLLKKFPQYHSNPGDIIRLAIFNSIHADDTLLDDMLEQLRSLDSLANIKF